VRHCLAVCWTRMPESLVDLTLTPFTVAGRVNANRFHMAKAVALGCEAAPSCTVLELLPTEYAKLLVTLAEQYGGPAYMHEEGVCIYSEQAGWIGGTVAFFKWLEKNNVSDVQKAISSTGKGKNWSLIAEKQFQRVLCESERSFVFLELAVEGDGVIGRLVFELFPNLAPKTCDNFYALCEKQGAGGYTGTPIHRVKVGGWMQGGDVVTGNGDGGASASGSPLPDESFHIKHCEYGVLGMANQGTPHSATSQFYVTFAPCPSFNNRYVSFGKLVDGHKLLKFIEDSDVANERPRMNLTVSACGKVMPFTDTSIASDFYASEDEAAAKLQSMHKARLQRKENADRKAAAARVQAAKRGQIARKEAKEQRDAAVKVQAISRGRNSRKAKA